MRLINVDTLEMQEFFEPTIPLSFSDITDGLTRKAGMAKLKGCCKQAKKDKLDYVWIDTCCINKESSKELDEAINSMFQWYRRASVCYTYMSDVPEGDDIWDPTSRFYSSSWFQRGWTLQELLAPVDASFYNEEWNFIGTKADLSREIEDITGIPRKYLLGWADFHQASVAQRMSWAAKRETKRTEDIAYCLLGIFNISMSMIYGEKEKAFERLQLKILEQTTDDSILAWGWTETDTNGKSPEASNPISAGIFASSPRDFACCGHVVPHAQRSNHNSTLTVSGGYLHTSLRLKNNKNNKSYAMLNCCSEDDDSKVIAIPLHPASSANEYIRPQNQRPILVKTPSVEDPSQNLQIKIDRQVHPLPTAETSTWLHVEGYQKLELKLAETYPPLEWKRSRALLTKKTMTNPLPIPSFFDSHQIESPMRSYVIQALRKLTMEDIEKSLEFMDPKSLEVNTTDNGVTEVAVTLTQETVPQGVVYLVSLESTNTVPTASDKVPAIITAKLKYDFMDALRKEHLTGSTERPALDSLAALQDRRKSVEATMRAIEEEEKALADRKSLVLKDLESLTDRIAAEEAQIQGRPESYRKFKRDRLKTQSILDGESVYFPNCPTNQSLFLLVKEDVVHGPGNWFEKIIQRRLERVSETSLLWPVEVEQDMKNKDQPLLVWAAANKKADIVEILLEKGSDIKVKDKNGCTALCVTNNTQITEILLNHGAQLETRNLRNNTPLICAARGGWKKKVAFLLKKGADIEARNSLKNTALASAVLGGDLGVIGLLLDKGADAESKNDCGDTPLAIAAIKGQTPLALAAINGRLETTKLLLKNGADIEARDKDEQTPLACAVMKGNVEVVEVLLEEGADIEVRDVDGRSPLALAAMDGSESIVKLLLEKDANVNSRDLKRVTALWHAASLGHESIIKMLSNEGAKLDVQGRTQLSPLMVAQQNEHKGTLGF
ncbi:Vegetative incompatibility protein HET-E-1 [Fusarium culmorum]|uniref:Vegetative incompatibility protein HET-E-1 n=1 Tax=Fusarium culmorum TaxID=5516 RepID=A0A2T4GS24_FUSCU|nr:Vegetative incompatibility protein HET-E-1 [Fusarium culmorum]